MRNYLTILSLVSFMAVPASAQDGQDELREGMSLLQQGTKLLLEGLMSELGPALENLENMVIDLNAYHRPEVLPNGDIIIRRKERPAPELPENGEIEL